MKFTKKTYRKARHNIVIRALGYREAGLSEEYAKMEELAWKIGNRARREKGMWL